MRRWFGAIWARLHGGLDSRPFVRLVQTHTLNSAGDACVAVALAGSIFFSEDPQTARSRVALSLLLTMAPFALVAPFIGPLIDRAPGGRRLILFSAASARALLCLLMATFLDTVALYPIAFLSLVFSKTHAVAKSASVPEIVQSQTALVKANSVLALSAVVSGFVMATLGYGIAQLFGDEWVLRIGALIFSAAAALALEVGTMNYHPAKAAAHETVVQLRDTGILLAGAVMSVLRMCVGFLAFLIAFDLRRDGAATWWFGFAISAGMIGSSLGNLIAPHLRGHIREEWILTSAVGFVCIASIAATQQPSRVTSAGLALILGMAAAAGKLSFDSLVQRDAPSAVHGRSFGRFEAAFQLVWVIGALAPVTFTISTKLGYWILALATGTAALWYMLSPRRRLTERSTES